ncbi:SH3 domain-containing protein [Aquimarina sp. TRL1]|uniref:SH3 domain-containing protein n=1 Tax=Aquimarina sp. (strain TRL1) TaxID=2736252 RepID=UPI001588E605|nr:SH3 domain-containing protein [Aquimarina sp. TRL1]QKX05358.1 SH3 domain-containing protein [Aquimarina sp. TRL1]
MNNLNNIIKSIQKQNHAVPNTVGLSGLTSNTKYIQSMNKINSNLTGLGGISEIARDRVLQTERLSKNTMLGRNLAVQSASLQVPKNNFVLSGLISSLSQLKLKNKLVSDKLAGLVTSQLTVTGNLGQIAQTIQQSHLNKFNTLSVALQGVSNSFLKEVAIAKTWEDFDIVEEANETISNIAEETLNQTTTITQSDLEEFRTSILNKLTNLLSKSNSERARNFIIELITVIGFVLTLYTLHQQKTDKSNSQIIIETKKELEKLSSDFSQKISIELQKMTKTRVAKTNVNLRFAAKKNSRKIGLVKKGQIVTVIETRHKYLLISYIDFETEEPKSGFVVKKYFATKK